MHQTFYIDIDEEITSIVERLRRSASKEVVIVVPKRALLIQSIINLKLLKKEADELNKRVIIVTQDKFGKLMVEKTGITVEQRLDDISGDEMPVSEKAKINEKIAAENYDSEARQKGNSRLDKIGSPGFFYSDIQKNKKGNILSDESVRIKNVENEKLTNTELVTDIGSSIKGKGMSIFDDRREKADSSGTIKSIDIKQRTSDDFDNKDSKTGSRLSDSTKKQGLKLRIGGKFFKKEKLSDKDENSVSFGSEMGNAEEKEFSARIESGQKDMGNGYRNVKLSNKSWKLFLILGSIAVLAVLFSGIYLFLPKAKVTIFSKTKITSADLEVKADAGSTSVNFEESIVPSRVISVSFEFSDNFEATGSRGSSNNKARGMITIYNEHSSANQALVATTRFLSESGKLFRLANSVIVPGVTTVGSESKPGAIEAEVIADESGEEFNIGPEKFSIPGFQNSGNEKYKKIYAKSFKTMTGGGAAGETVKTVTDTDISSAKSQALSEANLKIKEKLKDEAGDGYMVLDESISLSDPVYKISNSSGDTANSFTVNLKTEAKAVIFREGDLKSATKSIIEKNAGEGKMVVENSLTQEFGKAEADFTNSVLRIKIHAVAKIAPILDLEVIKKGILGKNKDELEAYLKSYSDIAKVEVEYWPAFISGRIPQYESRVEVVLDNN